MKKNLGLAKLILSLPLAFAFSSCAYQKASLDKGIEAEVATADKGLIPTASVSSAAVTAVTQLFKA